MRCCAPVLGVAALSALLLAASPDNSAKLTVAEARKLKNPIPYTLKSIGRGHVVFSRNCTGCHGADGKAALAAMAEATDLTSPKLYKHGTTEGEIFRSIRDGAGDQMPPFKSQIEKENDIWHLVNFIRSLWPAAERPPLQEDKTRSVDATPASEPKSRCRRSRRARCQACGQPTSLPMPRSPAGEA